MTGDTEIEVEKDTYEEVRAEKVTGKEMGTEGTDKGESKKRVILAYVWVFAEEIDEMSLTHFFLKNN